MSFQINCPNCGRRPVGEFRFGGPVQVRPEPTADVETWTDYLYNRSNVRGVQREWWYHRSACKSWFLAERDTRTNMVLATQSFVPEEQAHAGAK